jgi:hypothetical protein
MCFTRSCRVKREQKRPNKVYRVHPKPPPPSFNLDEVIQCQGCFQRFSLDQIKINCAGCDKFFHCKIAGTCYGKHCTSEFGTNQVHRLSWCINCVPGIPANKIRVKREDPCICNECYTD